MLKLDSNLISNLPRIMGETIVDFTDKVFGEGRKHMYSQQKMKNWSGLSGYHFAKICNVYHIPVSRFIINDCDEISYASMSQLVLDGDWKEVKFTPENLRNEYRSKDNNRIQMKTFAESMGTTSNCLYRWFADGGKCSCTVEQVLMCVHKLNIPLSFFFVDSNMPLPTNIVLDTNEGAERTLNEIRQLREQVRQQSTSIRNLQNENRNLREQSIQSYNMSEAVGEYNTRIRPFMFNQMLWDNLCVIFGKSKREIERLSGVRSTVARPTVIQLINVCNALGISTHHFIVRSINMPDLHNSSYYKTSSERITFDPDRLGMLFCVGNILGKTRKNTLELISVNDMVVRRWMKPDSTLTVNHLIDLCNALDVLPDICINDPNERHYGTTITELLLEENMVLKLRIADFENKNKKQSNSKD